MEEYNPNVVHVAGANNEAADALSRLDMDDNEFDEIEWHPPRPPLSYSQQRMQLLYPMASEQTMDPDTGFPLATDLIRFYQQKDKKLRLQARTNKRFTIKEIEGQRLILDRGKIVIPDILVPRVLDWYHQIHYATSRVFMV